ncbi:MAG: tRNA lysidine(34) synthetase TilS [Planctomycetota bacterium]
MSVSGPQVDAAAVGAWSARVRAAWRTLTGGSSVGDEARPTLVACSGGADSAALAIILGEVPRARIVIAHVAHDLRPAELVNDDAAAVLGLARRLGRPCVLLDAPVGPGNAEAEARRSRYAALERAAVRLGIGSIATGHHCHDQFETMVMALLRGGSPGAVAGMPPVRDSGAPGVRLLRPMLSADPAGAGAVCRAFGLKPRTDHTNADPAFLRARMRRVTLSELAEQTEGLAERLATSRERLLARSESGQVPRSAKNERTSASSRSSSATLDTL